MSPRQTHRRYRSQVQFIIQSRDKFSELIADAGDEREAIEIEYSFSPVLLIHVFAILLVG